MVLMTMIARVVDGLPLAATMQEDEQVTMKNTVNINCTTCCTSLQFVNVIFNSKYIKNVNLNVRMIFFTLMLVSYYLTRRHLFLSLI